MCFLKRALPFAATLLLGLMLGNFAGRVNPFERANFINATQSGTSRGYSCRLKKRKQNRPRHSSRLQILGKPEAQYTDAARLAGIEGTVRLRAVFDSDGTIKDVQPLATLPFGLTDSAMRAAYDIEFVPEKMNGFNVPVERLVEYHFDLR